jgi:hypothetical protein
MTMVLKLNLFFKEYAFEPTSDLTFEGVSALYRHTSLF